MIEIQKKEDCCGCTACYSVCPTKAIVMNEDNEGFTYPVVDKAKCVDCGRCQKVCPIQSPAKNKTQKYGAVYAVQNKNEKVRAESTAGGFFSVIAEQILTGGGYVCAAGWKDKEHIVVAHKIVKESLALKEMRGSKYVQSNLGDVFNEIKQLLKKGIRCLFVGTPCQVNVIQKVLGFNPLLITIDLLCLGVSSPKIFDMWIEYLEEKYKDHVSVVYFRDKHYGYSTANVRIKFDAGKILEQKYDAKSYLRTFFSGYNVRPSCYDCKFRCVPRVSDFTMGDYHQIAQVNKSMDDDLGTTIVWVNSEEGTQLFTEVQDRITTHLIASTHDNCIGRISKLTKVPSNRESFYADVNSMSYKQLVKKWEPNSAKAMLVNVIKVVVNKTPLRGLIFKAIKRRKAKQFEKRVQEANR